MVEKTAQRNKALLLYLVIFLPITRDWHFVFFFNTEELILYF